MAWISVHQSIVGPKLRQFTNLLGCSQWEAEGILVSLWLWGLDNADKFGLVPYADRTDIEIALSGSSKRSRLALAEIVDALIESGWIDEAGDGIYIHDWEVWQDQWYKAKERREADMNRKRKSREKGKVPPAPEPEDAPSEDSPTDSPADIPQNVTKEHEESAPPTDPPPETPAKPKRKVTNYGPEFEEFWKAYPRQIGKGEAFKKYQARRNDGWSAEDLMTAAKNYALQCARQHTDKNYIKHPKTFLSENTPFVDYLPKKPTASPEATVPDGSNPFAEYGKGVT
ncbi:MAG: hypothetical protein IKJ99_03750 [Oscillospiraceae bacterium]|nr:hypothetical protein [Oscillospiraceae bacterium]